MFLRTACPHFHTTIGHPHFETSIQLSLRNFRDWVELKFCDSWWYIQKKNGCEVIKTGSSKFVEGDFIELAIQNFAMLVDNPNLRIKCFEVSVEGKAARFLAKLQDLLMKVKLKVAKFEMNFAGNQADLLHILPHLDSEALKSLKLTGPRFTYVYFQFDELVKLEQWKTLEKLEMFEHRGSKIEHWWDIPDIEMERIYASPKDLQRMLKHFRTAPNFKSANIQRTGYNTAYLVYILQGWAACYWRPYEHRHQFQLPRTPTKHGLHVETSCDSIRIRKRSVEVEEDDDWPFDDPTWTKRILILAAVILFLLKIGFRLIRNLFWRS